MIKPSQALVLKEVLADVDFREQYMRARETQADVLAEEIVEIADDGRNDWMEINDPDNPGYKFNGEHSARSRLRVDARKWFASKVAPKKYGDKIEATHQGPGGGPIAIERIERVIVDPGARPNTTD